MKILIHGINFSPELTGIGKYSGEMAEWLALQGHEVRVVTAPPYYPQWKIADGFANGWYTASVNLADGLQAGGGSLRVYRCPLWVPAKPSGLKRLLHLASFALMSLPVMLRQVFWRPDVVLVVEPPLFCAPQAWLVARLCGAKAWLHIQDFEVDAAFDLGLVKGARLRKCVSMAERWLMRRFDQVSTISQRMLDRLKLKGVAADRCAFFPNWVDIHAIAPGMPIDVNVMQTGLPRRFAPRNDGGGGLEEAGLPRRFAPRNVGEDDLEETGLPRRFAPRNDGGGDLEEAGLPRRFAPRNDGGGGLDETGLPRRFVPRNDEGGYAVASGYRSELGIAEDAVVALYSGNMGGKQGLEILALVAVLLIDLPNVVFVFCGNGAERHSLEHECAGLHNVRFLDLQPLARLGELLCMADIHLLPQRADAADLVMPSKLTGMLASGRPVVATAAAGTELAKVVAGCGLACGIVVPPASPIPFAAAIETLVKDTALRARLGAAGRKYAEEFLDKESVLRRFEAELTRLVMPQVTQAEF